MKPAWDTLIEEYKDSTTSLVADVDCTAGGKSLCDKHKVEGYPTIKYGDPSDLQDYEGGRTLEDFQEFASENLGPSCSPENRDLCSEKEITLMDKYMAKMSYDLEELIEKKEKLMANAESKFNKEKAKLQRQISDAEKEKDKKIKKIKKTGLGMMRKVKAHKEKMDPDNKEDL